MKDKYLTWLPKKEPHEPPAWDEDIVYAYRSFVEGVANDGQQKLVDLYIQYITGTGQFEDLCYRPESMGGDRAQAFAEGKRFVGLQLKKLLGAAITEAIEREREKAGRQHIGTRRSPSSTKGA